MKHLLDRIPAVSRLLAIAAVPILGAAVLILFGVACSFATGAFVPFIGWGPFITMLVIAIAILAGCLTELAHRLLDYASGSTVSRPRRNRRF